MKWYQVKEQAAGEKRLLITWEIYKIFGKKAVKLIAFLVTLFAFPGAKEARRCSKRFLEIIGLNPSLKNQFRHFLEYSYSLVDNIEVFSGNYDYNKIIFASEENKILWDKIIAHGGFLIFSHLGNINILRAFLNKYDVPANVFMSTEQAQIFNGFIKKIEVEVPVTTYPVEKIGIDTSIEVKEKLARGEIVFMAGDRTSRKSTNTEVKFLGQNVFFPQGTFVFARLMESPVYFVCALRDGENYRVYIREFISSKNKSERISQMQEEYIAFLESLTYKAPLQFFNFYDMFGE